MDDEMLEIDCYNRLLNVNVASEVKITHNTSLFLDLYL